MNLIFQCRGGIGKAIMSTAIITAMLAAATFKCPVHSNNDNE